jgi:hypothetical protein
MTSKTKSQTPRKTRVGKTSVSIRWGRVFAVWAVALVAVALVVERDQLPQPLRGNSHVAQFYSKRDAVLRDLRGPQNPAAIEPAAGTPGVGYKSDDRRELDSLISRGSYGHEQ